MLRLGRRTDPALDLLSEASIAAAAAWAAAQGPLDLVIDATGFLHDEDFRPERSWRELDATHMAKSFALNTIGPALLMKHSIPSAALSVMPNCGHTINIEEPDEFNRLVGAFLVQVDCGRWPMRDARTLVQSITGIK